MTKITFSILRERVLGRIGGRSFLGKKSRMESLGFTLIELMIVATIIGILAAIAIPKFADLVTKSKEGATKGSLGAVRSALSIYYGDMEGTFPLRMSILSNNAKWLAAIPMVKLPGYHSDTSVELNGTTTVVNDASGWAYVNDTTDIKFGTLWVNCTHTDTKGTIWSGY